MSEAYDGPQVVGMDLHRRRSVLVGACVDPVGSSVSLIEAKNTSAIFA
jgi:hypothetical protein